jgi:hypothetical protein
MRNLRGLDIDMLVRLNFDRVIIENTQWDVNIDDAMMNTIT